jgi:hypothetical protein
MSKLLAACFFLFCLPANASTGYFLLEDKKLGLRVNQDLLSFLDYQADFLANRYNFINKQSINVYLPNESKLGLSFSFDSKLKKDEARYNYFVSFETRLW